MKTNNLTFDIAVIGGGSAGMAAALKASESGAKVVLIERENRLGGILNQCIHNGFGLSYFKEELTGPEYAGRFIKKVEQSNITVLLNTTVLSFENGYILNILNKNGIQQLKAKSIILSMGCRERPPAAISLCGTRPAGVVSAGSAQKMINIYGKMIGKNVVIVGSGDIGLIMARRLHYEGAKVLGVYEILPHPSGLKRNIAQCLTDYNIPLHLSKTVVEVVGKERVEGVIVAPVKSDFSFDLTKKEFIPCDSVVLSIGLVPENDLAETAGVKQNNVTNGALVDEYLQTNLKGVFSCGNVLHVHDIVDNVTKEAERAGESACKFVLSSLNTNYPLSIKNGFGVRYTSPQTFYKGEGILSINFRVSNIFENANIVVKSNDKEIRRIEKRILLPAEMETVIIAKKDIDSDIEIFIETK
ncbi:MAG: FAD-dependent oxidoreductase [Clostridia bacterium]|nr:FAD-dependent oxidoreductase [Clostridia bacterium]